MIKTEKKIAVYMATKADARNCKGQLLKWYEEV